MRRRQFGETYRKGVGDLLLKKLNNFLSFKIFLFRALQSIEANLSGKKCDFVRLEAKQKPRLAAAETEKMVAQQVSIELKL